MPAIAQNGTSSEGLVRAIGRWSMAALIVNCIIGSGVFGLPSVLAGLLGRASVLAVVLGGVALLRDWRRLPLRPRSLRAIHGNPGGMAGLVRASDCLRRKCESVRRVP